MRPKRTVTGLVDACRPRPSGNSPPVPSRALMARALPATSAAIPGAMRRQPQSRPIWTRASWAVSTSVPFRLAIAPSAAVRWPAFAPVPGKDTCAMPAVIHPAHERVILEGVCWHTYECLLADFADSHAVRVAYDQGILEIMAPSYAHEELNHLIARVVEIIATEMDMDFVNAGSTTFKRQELERGFEPDSSFYLVHVAAIRGKTTIDMALDPPPDLVVEIDLMHPSLDKLPIYAAVGVPEVWRYQREQVLMYRLTGAVYEVVETSVVLPGLTGNDIVHWLEASQQLTRPAWVRQVHAW